jgi:opacity protein-like surface antigen
MLQRLSAAALIGATGLFASTGQGAAQSPFGTDWTGLYAGAQIGWGWADGDATLEVDRAGYDGDVDGSSLNYGFTVGYRHDLGQFVVGGEAQFDWSDTNFEDVEVDGLAGSVDDAGRLKDMWRIVGLAGYDTGRTLFYGTLGWARGSIETPNELFDGGGWVVGAGADYLLTERLTVGGQISYHVFDDISKDLESFDLDVTRVQARMTYRF